MVVLTKVSREMHRVNFWKFAVCCVVVVVLLLATNLISSEWTDLAERNFHTVNHNSKQEVVKFGQTDSEDVIDTAENVDELDDSANKKLKEQSYVATFDPDSPEYDVSWEDEASSDGKDSPGTGNSQRVQQDSLHNSLHVQSDIALKIKEVRGKLRPNEVSPAAGDSSAMLPERSLPAGQGGNLPRDEAELVQIQRLNAKEVPVKETLLEDLGDSESKQEATQSTVDSAPGQAARPFLQVSVNPARINSPGGPYSDSPMLKAAYWRSPCSALSEKFVGSEPLFPPCQPAVPPGVAKWGKYPYIGPFKYINESKNPCFYDEKRNVRCVPYFFEIGFSKCGTSDLYSRIIKHPQIVGTNKEMKWFSRLRFPQYYYKEVESFDRYLQYFNGLAFQLKRQIKLRGFNKKIVGDYSIEAVNEVFEWPQLAGNEGCTEPRVINANHIAQLNPKIKIIVIMREPAQRLYSRFLFDYDRATLMDYRQQTVVNRSLRTPQVFHQFVVHGLAKYTECFRTQSLRHCVYNRTLWETVHGLKIQDSLYAVLLEDWLRVIPRDRFLFLRTEDFKKDVRGYMEKVFQFLELDPIDEARMQKICNARPSLVGRHNVGPMLPETRTLLTNFFRPFVNRLEELLQDPKFLWKDLYKRTQPLKPPDTAEED